MTRQDVLARIAQLIADQKLTQVPIAEITEGSLIADDLGMDSVKTVEVLVSIEESFEIQFTDGELNPGRLAALRNLVDNVLRHLEQQRGAVS